jgi:hypothetical protein
VHTATRLNRGLAGDRAAELAVVEHNLEYLQVLVYLEGGLHRQKESATFEKLSCIEAPTEIQV